MKALGLVQVYLEMDAETDDAARREAAFAHEVLERVAQTIRHRAADERLTVHDVRVAVLTPREV